MKKTEKIEKPIKELTRYNLLTESIAYCLQVSKHCYKKNCLLEK